MQKEKKKIDWKKVLTPVLIVLVVTAVVTLLTNLGVGIIVGVIIYVYIDSNEQHRRLSEKIDGLKEVLLKAESEDEPRQPD